MADNGGQDLLSKLSARGEEALGKLADVPGGTRVAEAIRGLRAGLDDLQKKMRGVEALEKKVALLEKKVAHLEAKAKPAAPKRAAPKRAAAPKKTTPKPPPPTA